MSLIPALQANAQQCPLSVWQPTQTGESDPAPFGIAAACRPFLARNLNITQRYFLAKSATLKRPSGRTRQVAAAHKMNALLEAPYHLVGQTPATTMVLSRVFSHIALCSPDPLVLVYAGMCRILLFGLGRNFATKILVLSD